MKAEDDDDYELADLEKASKEPKEPKEPKGLPPTVTNHDSVYYDDTLVTKPSSRSTYLQLSDDYEPCVGVTDPPTAHCTTPFTPEPQTRRLPTPPPETATDRIPCQWGQRSNNGTILKHYKAPTKRDSLMRALDKSTVPETKFRQQSSRCRAFALILSGILLTAALVAATYFIVRSVSTELCPGSADRSRPFEDATFLYGEVEFSNFNETSTAEFEKKFIREVNKAVEDTILSYFWINATVIGLKTPGRSGQNMTRGIVCHFGLNLQLQANRRRDIATFAKFVIEKRLTQLTPGGASVLCVVLVEQDNFNDHNCNEKITTPSMETPSGVDPL